MSENAKTMTFVAIGLCAIVLGLATAPSSAEVDETTLNGVNLTKAFDNPDAAKRLRIVRFDEDTATLREFDVAEKDGLWSIPSKDGYPADAAKQMAEAATSLMDRRILHLASKNAGDHEQYGVIDPLSPKLEPGQKGVGTRVTMSDAQGKPLADLIVGKTVRDAEGQRYVREAGRDVVYVIEIDPSKLTTSFEDWIEKDLLKLNGWDLKQVEVKDYSAELVQGMTRDGRIGIGIDPHYVADMTFSYNEADGKWNPVKLQRFDSKNGKDGKYVDFALAQDEELNDETLNGLKTALDELKIVDVVHKPQGLSNDLKAGADFLNSRDALVDLMTKGFTAAPPTDRESAGEIVSSDGEVIATMKNGTEYVLRFGNLTNVGGSDKQNKEENADAKSAAPGAKDKKGDKTDVHRYMFVMARFNKDAVKQPELVKLPELLATAEAKADPAAKEGEAPDANKEEGEKKADDAEAKKEDAESKDKPAEGEAKDKPADDAEKKDDAAATSEAAPDKELEKVIAERKQIEQENQRKLDEYQALLKKGEENVKDLNLRFGDWYFVVNDDVFQKVRLSRDKVIKKKDAKAAGEDAGAAGAMPGGRIPGLPPIPGASQ